MGTVQSSYNDTHLAAYAGMIADTQHAVIVSGTVETAAIGFGKVVTQGVADNGLVSAAGGTKFKGISVRDQSVAPTSDTYSVGDNLGYVVEGVVWVTVGEAVVAGDPAYFTAATGVINKTVAGNVAIPNGTFETAAAASGLARLRLR